MEQFDGAASRMSGLGEITAGFSPFADHQAAGVYGQAFPSREAGFYHNAPGGWSFSSPYELFSRKNKSVKPEELSETALERDAEDLHHRWQGQIAGLEKLVKDSCSRGEQGLALEYVEQIDLVMKKVIALNTAGSLAGIVSVGRRRLKPRGINLISDDWAQINWESQRRVAENI